VKKSRFSGAPIVATLEELDAATPAAELARQHGPYANTIRQRRDRYARLETSDLYTAEAARI
jgi:hypothetical protein